MKSKSVLVVALLVVACHLARPALAQLQDRVRSKVTQLAGDTPLTEPEDAAFQTDENSWLLALKPGVAGAAKDALESNLVGQTFTFRRRLNLTADNTEVWEMGLTRAQLVAWFIANPTLRQHISAVERNMRFNVTEVQLVSSALWNLDRIDQRPSVSSGDGKYSFLEDGSGTTIYVLDSGIRTTHSDFQGRASFGYSFFESNDIGDCNGHGTHVAGTAAGATFGVAKGASVVSVKVLDCDGSGSTVSLIEGLRWVFENHNSITDGAGIINMSLGGPKSPLLDELAQRITQIRNIPIIVAAGNSDQDACDGSPSGANGVVTVAASTRDDKRASFSNFGNCVDIFAPGVEIFSASPASDSATQTLSGTSMAAPAVAGAVALILEAESFLLPSEVTTRLKQNATAAIEDALSTNLLLYNSFSALNFNAAFGAAAPSLAALLLLAALLAGLVAFDL